METWFNKHKVLIIGLLMAIALPINDLITTGETSKKVIIISAATAALAFLSRNIRGQWATIIGLIGTTLATYLTMVQTGQQISWSQIVLQFVIAVLAAIAPPAKSRGYENTPLIATAKKEGERLTPTSAPPQP